MIEEGEKFSLFSMERVMNSIPRHAFFLALQRQVQCAVTFPQQHQDSSAMGTATVLANSSRSLLPDFSMLRLTRGADRTRMMSGAQRSALG